MGDIFIELMLIQEKLKILIMKLLLIKSHYNSGFFSAKKNSQMSEKKNNDFYFLGCFTLVFLFLPQVCLTASAHEFPEFGIIHETMLVVLETVIFFFQFITVKFIYIFSE